MRTYVRGLAALVVVVVALGCGGGSGGGPGGGPNQPPVVTSSFDVASQVLQEGQLLSFEVTATDPEGDDVALELLNPPVGGEFARAVGSGTVARTFRWILELVTVRRPDLEFRATDSNGNAATLLVPLALPQARDSAFLCSDVTGDGVRDAVVRAAAADANAADDGAIYVYAGASTPGGVPTARLVVPGAANGAGLGDAASGVGMVCCDVTGDGVADVVAAAEGAHGGAVGSGAVYVFAGGAGMVGLVGPTAKLTRAASAANDRLGNLGVQCCDVTGDQVPDVVSGSFLVDVGGIVDAGIVCVWGGGPGLVGVLPPTATLARPAPVASDEMGSLGFLCHDVTGDGRDDVVVVSPNADTTVVDAGAVDVWAGAPGLVGAPAPTATLQLAAPTAGDRLGISRVRCCDVTGDAADDVVVASWLLDVGGVADAGALHVWAGGPALAGVPAPTATLTRAVPVASDMLGGGLPSFLCYDVTGDGRLDVVATAPMADVGGVGNAGEALVWAGGAGLTGTPAATATLNVPAPTAGDGLGSIPVSSATALTCSDVTGDGLRDVLLVAASFDGGVVDEGALFVWQGGASLTGTPLPRARLTRAAPVAGDALGQAVDAPICCDVVGDGALDIVVGAGYADVGGVVDAGLACVFQGGAALVGNVTPTATLQRTAPVANDNVAWSGTGTLRCFDVTGDGRADVLVGAPSADVGGVVDAGELLLWHGGAGLTGTPPPSATLRSSTPVAGEKLSQGSGLGVIGCDVTGDGVLDVVTQAIHRDVGAATAAGAVFFWRGGALTGTPAGVQMTRTAPVLADRLGLWFTHSVHGCDLTGDGILDLVTGAASADVGGVVDAGAVFFWKGGATPTSTPTVEMTAPGAATSDRLGE